MASRQYVCILYTKDVFQRCFWKLFGSFREWREPTKFSFWRRNNSQTYSSYKTEYFKTSKIVLCLFSLPTTGWGLEKERFYGRNLKVEILRVDFIFISVQSWITFSSNCIDLCGRARGWKNNNTNNILKIKIRTNL